jgi:proteasome assembly chaperone (PAC2) family protein
MWHLFHQIDKEKIYNEVSIAFVVKVLVLSESAIHKLNNSLIIIQSVSARILSKF